MKARTYSTFTMGDLKTQLGLTIDETGDFSSFITEVELSQMLQAMLQETLLMALSISTEKARSEMIIAPILIEVRRQLRHTISLFSGTEFNVDRKQHLVGVCDFIISLSSEQLTVNAPVVMIVEAKNENLRAGIAQCAAEMVAASLFHQHRGAPLETIYGVVTTGSTWKFLSLHRQTVRVDLKEYYIEECGPDRQYPGHDASAGASHVSDLSPPDSAGVSGGRPSSGPYSGEPPP